MSLPETSEKDEVILDLDAYSRSLECTICQSLKNQGQFSLHAGNDDQLSICEAHTIVINAIRLCVAETSARESDTFKIRSSGLLSVVRQGEDHSQATWIELSNLDGSFIHGIESLGCNIYPRTILPESTGSILSCEFISQQLHNCKAVHTHCNTPRSDWMPSRLLDIRDVGRTSLQVVRLVEAEAISPQPYVALSHCWGQTSHVVTTRERLESHKEGLPLALLSKTCQEAILFARHIAEFFWVDTLCIIQDDLNDWERESARMMEIYQKSVLTIAASRAVDQASGCFSSLREEYNYHKAGKIKSGGKTFDIFARKLFPHITDMNGRDSDNDLEFPLLHRAWAYQERLLSPRVVHFTNNELCWECNESCACECGLSELLPKSYKLRLCAALSQSVNERTWAWSDFVEDYSGLRITYLKDRLPALAGIARQWHSDHTGKYMAGHWQNELPLSLAWRKLDSGGYSNKHLGPSWSWQSVEGHVRIETYPFYYACSAILRCECTILGPNTYGQVVAGRIEIEGHLLPGVLSYATDHNSRLGGKYEISFGGGVHSEIFFADYELSAPGKGKLESGQSLWSLKISKHESDESSYWLILRSTEGREKSYQRIGLARPWKHSLPEYLGGRTTIIIE